MCFADARSEIIKESAISAHFLSGPRDLRSRISNSTTFVVAVVALCATCFLDISELILVLVGAATYCGMRFVRLGFRRNGKLVDANVSTQKLGEAVPLPLRAFRSKQKQLPQQRHQQNQIQQEKLQTISATRSSACVRQPSVVPVQAPTFVNAGWDSEIEELLDQIRPTPKTDALVQRIVDSMSKCIKSSIPGAHVSGFVGADPTSVKAFAVAVPEIDVVVRANPDVLLRMLQQQSCVGSPFGGDLRRIQKAAIRVCTDDLVSSGGFKFRRSGFTGDEPKVTFLAPPVLTGCDVSVSADFSVNAVTPARSSALLAECGRLDPRARDLILLVRRWARDRGIAHSSKGHLSPYAWVVLVVHFLQNHPADGGGKCVLPALSDLVLQEDACFHRKIEVTHGHDDKHAPSSNTTVASLFAGFFHFYSSMDAQDQMLVVRREHGNQPTVATRRVQIQQGFAVADPFDMKRNLCANVTTDGYARFKEELKRAHEICSGCSASVSKLLEPWAPPDEDVVHGLARPSASACCITTETPVSRPGRFSAPLSQSLRPNGESKHEELQRGDAHAMDVVNAGPTAMVPPWRAANRGKVGS